MSTLDIALTGGSLITRPFGDFHAPGYDELTELLRAADAGFTNLETVVQAPGAPSARPFAGYPPEALDDGLGYEERDGDCEQDSQRYRATPGIGAPAPVF